MFHESTLIFTVIIAAYLLGSIPFGLIFTKLSGHGDIRKIGSGNIGATNVLRTGNRNIALLTLVFDASKGAFTVALTNDFTNSQVAALSGLFVVIGHCFPIWLKFKGGKGVATSAAVFAALDIKLGGIFVIVWLVSALISRYSSLAALAAVLAVTFGAFLSSQSSNIQVMIFLLSLLIWIRHYSNIVRLLNGTEAQIGKK